MAADAVELYGLGLDAFGRIQEQRELVVNAGGHGFPAGVALSQVASALEHHGGTGIGQHVELQGAAAVEADAVELGDGDFTFERHLSERHVGVFKTVAVDGDLKGLETVLPLPSRRDGLSDLKAKGGNDAVTGGPVGLR